MAFAAGLAEVPTIHVREAAAAPWTSPGRRTDGSGMCGAAHAGWGMARASAAATNAMSARVTREAP
jgi:hypothetical protein